MASKNSMFQCPVEAALSLLGGKYKCIILWHLLEAPTATASLQHVIPQPRRRSLTQQLRELEDAGVISRKSIPSCRLRPNTA